MIKKNNKQIKEPVIVDPDALYVLQGEEIHVLITSIKDSIAVIDSIMAAKVTSFENQHKPILFFD